MSKAIEMKEFPKRDFLVSLELKAQAQWENDKLFETDAGCDGEQKYMATFPYPYQNGRLHLGHSFSLSKPQFQIGYQRMLGKKTLFPFGFHCTGMPIKAAADKLKREIELFGQNFEHYLEPQVEVEKIVGPKKHGKQQAKETGLAYQFQIMRQSGVKNEDIHKFADPTHWCYEFPPLAIKDCKRMGLHIDWRRSFITTDLNPYYDSFIRWQFNLLHSMLPSKVLFGERYTIYSPLDGQACMDHDRASGEGVGVQEYTGIKLAILLDEIDSTVLVKDVCVGSVLQSPEFKLALGSMNLYMVAATLRPETMYGQTNCFVGVDINYGVFAVSKTEAWICTDRSALNMAYQGLFEEKNKVNKIFSLSGTDLIGIPLSAPLSSYKTIFTLPMEGVLANKGTGVVTSVPSDSPDDFITLVDLAKKPTYYNIQECWVKPFLPPKAIISTPAFGNLAAVSVVESLKINSQKDKKQLAEAKDMVYKEGFYHGTIIVGEYAGQSVQVVKPLIKQMLIDQGLAFTYCEPEGQVISRSGDECVVTLASQWYIDYGEENWKKLAVECVEGMEMFTEETKNAFRKTLDWLNQWACSRSFGLGSKLPWDREWLIESLSDSTIYMAYYTVAHILHGGSLDGSIPGTAKIMPEDMTDEVWSHIMLEGPAPKGTRISTANMDLMKKEFNYFYPLDLRTSGKDLINNHLTFFIYNHVAIFPKSKWPQAVRVNGHLLLNNQKMSKSTGNFLNLFEALERYGADATRFALADAGDGLEDANFLEKTADDAILKLYTEREWIVETLESKLRTGAWSWNDLVFDAEINQIIGSCQNAYDHMMYREAIKFGYYDLQNARNEYRKATTGSGMQIVVGEESFEGMHLDLVRRFISIQALLLSPIIPHWCESIWMDLLNNDGSILNQRWPETKTVDEGVLAAANYVRRLAASIRSDEDAAQKKKKKKQVVVETQVESQKMYLFVASNFPDWQEKVIDIIKPSWNNQTRQFDGSDRQSLKDSGLMRDKKVMPFVAMIKKRVEENGVLAFDRRLLFSEKETLDLNMDYLRRELCQLKVSEIILVDSESVESQGFKDLDVKKAELSVPGQPTYRTF